VIYHQKNAKQSFKKHKKKRQKITSGPDVIYHQKNTKKINKIKNK
jgi:hypothetical protein